MQYYPQYCMAAVATTLILIAMCFLKQNYATKQNRVFNLMVIDSLIASGINIASLYTISFTDRYQSPGTVMLSVILLFRGTHIKLIECYVS